ncbi:hypothetical protein [Pseudoalteromonas ruthenica]|uniref:hypothetical protein n=1 Tax=Pseudoalteromonas ruthenica TaxID=151081 RepID=UPI00110A1BBD|nr:hypothetical protein [Pseudoalteromonas ruthenica]TMO87664.1 hypothetical protein CWC12_10310 [Pseudoalteromonas ruthenica]TMP22259.1 hypothetical protein CWC06_15700 [Pseudoalteromonas ruthenica]
MAKKLRIITSTFNIFEHGRTTHNNRPYLLKAVKRIIDHPRTQEALKNGELFGYFGHGKRALSNKLNPEEVEVATINGKPVVLEQVPACYCVALSVDDEGNVTHSEQLIDTEPGRVVDAMEASGAGGWSWATQGSPNNITGFGGFDYVKVPSYLSKEKQALMMESVGAESIDSLMLDNLHKAGIDEQSSQLLLESWNGKPAESPEVVESHFTALMLESMLEERTQLHTQEVGELKAENERLEGALEERSKLMMEAIESLPVLMSDQQRKAAKLESVEDLAEVKLMFESLTDAARTLPLGSDDGGHLMVNTEGKSSREHTHNNDYINFNDSGNPFKQN